MSAVLLDLVQQEVKNAPTTMRALTGRELEVIPGLVVPAISTAAGILPIIPEPYLESTTSGDNTIYKFGILNEKLVEYHYVTTPLPRIFKLGLLEDLAGTYVVIKFGTLVVRGASIAHCIGTVTR
jgi:hypothetical protein